MDNPTPTNPITPPPAQTPIGSEPTPPMPPVVSQPVQPPTPIESGPIEKPKSKNNFLMVVAIILLIMAVGAVGYFVYKNLIAKSPAIASYEDCAKAKGSVIQESFPPVCVTKGGQRFTQEVSPTPSTSQAPNGDLANWKTYTNTKYGFTFKYPQDFSLTLTSPDDQGVSFAPGSYKDLDFQNLPIISFYVYTDFTNGTGHQEFINALEGRGYSGIQNIEIKKFEGFEGTQFTSRDLQAGSGGLSINTVITLKKGILMISLSNSEKGMVDTYSQILSTFKFLDQSSAEGKFCGGIAANLPENQCPEGFYCKLDANHPDAGGVCTKK